MRTWKDPAGARLPARRAPAPVAGALIVAMLVVASCTATTTPSPSPSAEPTATPAASEGPVQKEPAETLDELLTRLYAAISAHDDAAFAATTMYGAVHAVYYTDGNRGSETASLSMDGYHVSGSGITTAEMTGESLVVGDVVAVPVAYSYPGEVDYGFDLMRIVHFRGGLLLGDGATIFGSPSEVDPDAAAVLEAEAAAWTVADADAVLATFTDDGAFWDGIVDGARTIHAGDELATWLADIVGFTVGVTSEPIASGTFVAATNRLTGDTAADFVDGISVYEIRGGKIALHVWASND